VAKKKSPPAAKKPAGKKTSAKKPPAKKKAVAKIKPTSSAGGGLELSITTAHKAGFPAGNNFNVQGTLSSAAANLTGWMVVGGKNVDPVNPPVAALNWTITFPGQPADTYAVYARATQGGFAAVDQILVVLM
jgi:hypothetical protein